MPVLDGDTAQKNSTGEKTGADVRFSIHSEFEKKYDQWDGSDPRVTFFLGTTGRALKNAGMVNQKIYFDASKILKIKNKHPEITDRVIKQIPSVLQNPIVIMKSKDPKNKPRKFNGYTIFGELYVGNNPVLVVLGADMYGRNGMKLDGVKVVSAYRRNHAQPFMDSSDVVFVTKNKERISMWEGRTGLRLPVGDSSTNSPDTTLPQTGSGVNTHSMQKGRKNAQNGGSNTQHSLETGSPDIRYSKSFEYDSYGGENLKDTPVHLRPRGNREWSAFNRSFANKTAGMEAGENKSIVIFTADYCYQVEADGYMTGMVISKDKITNEGEVTELYEKSSIEGYSDRHDANIETNGNGEGGHNRRWNTDENRKASERNDGLAERSELQGNRIGRNRQGSEDRASGEVLIDSRKSKSIDDTGLCVSDNSILVECENDSKYQYKYVVYDDMEDGPVIRDVYAIGRIDPNVEDDVASLSHNIARYIRDVEELKYDNTKQHESVLGTCIQDTSYLLTRYNNRSKRFHVIGRGSVENGRNTPTNPSEGELLDKIHELQEN